MDNRVVLIAAEGMIYTNGDAFGKTVYLAEGENADGWYEIPEAEFNDAFENGTEIGEATIADYQSALAEFGVKL